MCVSVSTWLPYLHKISIRSVPEGSMLSHSPSVEWCGVHTNGGELWWPCDVPGPHPYQGDATCTWTWGGGGEALMAWGGDDCGMVRR